ncbi:MAG: hypothetical protein IV112_09285 [Methyloversatilis discipulorum]|uniref:hypothetical protein n=1 Tax=Methyloversatilis discipulorum TaxID=1119528 RepID=UPI0026F1D737|nr:hypothetical protein [Methyloversatilis discipulorum]MBT9516874.1 hypothetical protein [Methyloversatilis discipulorum]
MTTKTSIRTLARLVDVREREVARLQADMAGKLALRQRYLGNIERLQSLCDGVPQTGSLHPLLSMNSAGYKQSVADMVVVHRQELAAHEIEIDLARRELALVSRRCEVLDQVLLRQRSMAAHGARVSEQKRQDDIAVQVWGRAP